ncbi:hypothetical protein DYY66_2354 [Candidatus Nitrosotalea sp. FS]|nr:hypothetical protein [Candidatus Nitrosotalea sp. FS]
MIGTMIVLYNLENVPSKQEFVVQSTNLTKTRPVKYRYKEAPYR